MILCFLILGFLMSVFFVAIYRKKDSDEQKNYRELTLYMEQLLCSCKRLESVSLAFQDCKLLFEKTSKMGRLLQTASEEIQNNGGIAAAFELIERRYNSKRLRLFHDFLLNVEIMGGEREDAFDILLHDLQMWKQRTFFYQKKKIYRRKECFLAIFLGVTMCFFALMLIPTNLRRRLMASAIYQITTILVFLILCGMLFLVVKKLSGNWLDKNETYNNMKEYFVLKKGKKGVRFGVAKQYCEKEVREEFPYWILKVVLYLQQESVYQAVKLTLDKTKGILHYELQNFLERLYEEPAALTPYLSFFRELNLPEVQTGMKILYSVNVNGYSHTGKQIRFLVEEMNRLMDQSQRRKFENETNYTGLIRQIPMILASGKILLDMFIVVKMILEQYGNLG